MINEELMEAVQGLRENLEIIKKLTGCYAVNFYSNGLKFQIDENKLDYIDGELTITERDEAKFPYRLSKTINEIEFFAITE